MNSARAQIGVHVFKILKEKLKQREIAGVLGIAQPHVAHLNVWPLQPLHHGQAAGHSEAAGPEGNDRGQSAPEGRTLSAGDVCSGEQVRTI